MAVAETETSSVHADGLQVGYLVFVLDEFGEL